MIKAIGVKLLNEYIKREFSTDPILNNINIEGEITNLRKNKFIYFDLKEEEDIISAVDFHGILNEFNNGDRVIINGYLTSYEKASRYQIVCKKAILSGEGQAHLNLLKLKGQLEKEGLFNVDKKLPLPILPKKIALITSTKGAAIDDFIHVMEDNYPLASLYIYPTKVQGIKSYKRITSAINQINKSQIELIVLTRGGGSNEDLSLFNHEKIVRSIYESKVPVITAIGHKRDESLSDLAADLSVSTPTKAAEEIARNFGKSVYNIEVFKTVIFSSIQNKIKKIEYILNGYSYKIEVKNPLNKIINEEYLLTIDKINNFNMINNTLLNLEKELYYYKHKIENSFNNTYRNNSYTIYDNNNNLLNSNDLLVDSSYYLDAKNKKIKIKIMEILDE